MVTKLDILKISINKNHYTINYNGFSTKTADSNIILTLLNKNYGLLINYAKNGNDLVLKFERITVIIKSIRNICKNGNDDALYNYLNSLGNHDILKLIKARSSKK